MVDYYRRLCAGAKDFMGIRALGIVQRSPVVVSRKCRGRDNRSSRMHRL